MIDELFKALSEDSRLRILALLQERELCVCEIEASLKMTQSNASRHLTILKRSGILDSYKQAQWTYYKISEKFKADDYELWNYLQRNLKNIPTYGMDNDEYKKCEGQNLCCKNIINNSVNERGNQYE